MIPAPTTEPNNTWSVRLRAAWRDDRIPEPIPEAAVHAAFGLGVRLRVGPTGYHASFCVTADQMALATRAAMARWSRLVEVADLPLWPIVSLEVTEVAPDLGEHTARGKIIPLPSHRPQPVSVG